MHGLNFFLWLLSSTIALPMITGLPPNHGIQEESGNYIFSRRKSREKERLFEKSGKIRELMFLIVSFQSDDFFYNQSRIQLNMVVAKLSLFVCHFVLCQQ